jgi:hypothetical protein
LSEASAEDVAGRLSELEALRDQTATMQTWCETLGLEEDAGVDSLEEAITVFQTRKRRVEAERHLEQVRSVLWQPLVETDLGALSERVQELQEVAPDILQEEVAQIMRDIPGLARLAALNQRYWRELFEGSRVAFYPQMSGEDVRSSGVLRKPEAIEAAHAAADREKTLNEGLAAALVRWNAVQIPLENGRLGDISPLLADIEAARAAQPRSADSREATDFVDRLNEIDGVLRVWSAAQRNYDLVGAFFQAVTPAASDFVMIRRRWDAVMRHAATARAVVQMLAFPDVLETLRDVNNGLLRLTQTALDAVPGLRAREPRLALLSDWEVISAFGNPRKYVGLCFASPLVLEENRIGGFVGLPFPRYVHITRFDDTVAAVAKAEAAAFMALYKAAESDQTRLTSFPGQIATLVLTVTFALEVDECFNDFQNNVHAFRMQETRLQTRLGKFAALAASGTTGAGPLVVELENELLVLKWATQDGAFWAAYPK